MKYYTVQKLSAWNKAKQMGFLIGDESYVDKEWLLNSYLWMMKQMAKRLENYNNEFPVWVWLDTTNICFSELLNDEWVLLEIEVPSENVLLSNFTAWHSVINDWDFDEENKGISKEEKWEYIFDKEILEKYGYGFDEDDLQGTIGKVDCKNIKVRKYITNSII